MSFLNNLINWIRLQVFCYNLICLPFRLAFLDNADYFKGPFVWLDYLSDIIHITCMLYERFKSKPSAASVHPAEESHFFQYNYDDEEEGESKSGNNDESNSNSYHLKKKNEEYHNIYSEDNAGVLVEKKATFDWTRVYFLFDILTGFPFELIAFAVLMDNFYLFRTTRLLQIVNIHSLFYNIINGSSVINAQMKRVGFINFFMIIIVHFMACLFYLIAINSLQYSDDITWLSKDKLVEIRYSGANESVREVVFLEGLFKRYIRAMYWSAQTITTVGLGDIGAHTDGETWLCTVYFFVAASFMYFSISNVALLISSMDSAKLEYLEKVERFRKYVIYRKLPLPLINRVISYYDYQWETLGGVNESEVLSEIPLNIQEQIRQETIRDKLVKYKAFRGLDLLQLNSISDQSETIFFCADDVIIPVDTNLFAMYIITKGELTCTDMANGRALILNAGSSFGSTALFPEKLTSKYEIKARTFAECIHIKGNSYRQICEDLMTREQFEAQMALVHYPDTTDILLEDLDENESIKSFKVNSKKLSVSYKSMFQIEKVSSKNSEEEGCRRFLYRKCYILTPESELLCLWSLIKLLGVIFYGFSITLLLIGSTHKNFLSHYQSIIIVNCLFDLIFVLDVVFSMSLFAFYKDGALETSLTEITRNYLKSQNLVFLVLSVFPFDVIVAFVYGWKYIPVCRILKLLHIKKLSEYKQICSNYLQITMGITISFSLDRCILLYFALFTLCHIVGCIWILCASLSVELFDYPLNWIIVDLNNKELGVGLMLDIDGDAFYGWCTYFRSIYWALSLMTSVAFPDIFAQNMLENIAIIVIMFFGCQVLNGIDGGISSLIMTFNKDYHSYNQKMTDIKQLVSNGALNSDLHDKVERYLEYSWSQLGDISETDVLSSLSVGLKTQVKSEISRELIGKVSFFESCSIAFVDYIINLLKLRLYLEGDPLCVSGEYGKELFIIESGNVIVTNADKTVTYATLKRGDYLGESCLLKVSKRTASAYAVGYCNIYVLTKGNFSKVSEKYPFEYHKIIPIIEHILLEKQQKNQKVDVNNSEVAVSVAVFADEIPLSVTSIIQPRITTESMGGGGKASQVEADSKEVSTSAAPLLINSTVYENTSEYKGNESLICLIPKVENVKNEKIEKNGDSEDIITQVQSISSPGSFARNIWSSILWCGTVYSLTVIPIRLSVGIPTWLFAFDYIFDLIFIIDAYLWANVFPLSKGGETIWEPKLLRERYVSKSLLLDLFVCFPFDIFFFVIPVNILRIPKVLRILSIGDYCAGILTVMEQSFGLNATFLRMLILTFSIVLFGVYTGSGYLILANNRNHGDCVDDLSAPYLDACEFRNTWVQLQVSWNRLSADGGSAFDRFILSLNFAIPLLTKITMAEVIPLNERESLYILFIMFLGLGVNGSILGNVIALVQKPVNPLKAKALSVQTELNMAIHPQIEQRTLQKSATYLEFLSSDDAYLLVKRGIYFDNMPYSISQEIDKELKLIPFLKKCPLFDTISDQICLAICSRLDMKIFRLGDEIITLGELGHEMYFIESGNVEVCSGDGKTVYTTISGSGFFGETALFFKSPRTATIRCSSQICVTHRLTKADLEAELLSFDFDVESMLKVFSDLQEGNKRRNETLMKNLEMARSDKDSKLRRLLGPTEVEDPCTSKNSSIFLKIRFILTPYSYFSFFWNLAGIFFLCYYACIIPFHVSFLTERDFAKKHFEVDFLIDAFFVVDIFMKIFCFSEAEERIGSDLCITDSKAVWETYKPTFKWDLIASIPLEIFYLSSGQPYASLCFLRLNHFIRVFQINNYVSLLQRQLLKFTSWNPKLTLVMVFKSGLLWIYTGHILACIYFSLHRYFERDREFTFATVDGLSTFDGKFHDVCSVSTYRCYSRSLYFVLSTMSSNGYGDIVPYGNLEYICQISVAIAGAFVGAIFAAYCGAFLQDIDVSANSMYQEKLSRVRRYLQYRQVSMDLSESILANYEFMWQNYKSIGTGSGHVFNELSQPMKVELSRQMFGLFLSKVVFLDSFDEHFRKKLCAIFQPQAVLAGKTVYRCGDTGRTLFFIKKGTIKLEMSEESQNELDSYGKDCLPLMQSQFSVLGDRRSTGNHFGEFSIISKAGLRNDAATAMSFTELLAVNESDLWQILLSIGNSDKYKLIYRLFTWNKDENHTPVELENYNSNNNANSNCDDIIESDIASFSHKILKDIILAMHSRKNPFVLPSNRIVVESNLRNQRAKLPLMNQANLDLKKRLSFSAKSFTIQMRRNAVYKRLSQVNVLEEEGSDASDSSIGEDKGDCKRLGNKD